MCKEQKKNNNKRQPCQDAEIAAEIKNSKRKASDSHCQKQYVRAEQNTSCENSEEKNHFCSVGTNSYNLRTPLRNMHYSIRGNIPKKDLEIEKRNT